MAGRRSNDIRQKASADRYDESLTRVMEQVRITVRKPFLAMFQPRLVGQPHRARKIRLVRASYSGDVRRKQSPLLNASTRGDDFTVRIERLYEFEKGCDALDEARKIRDSVSYEGDELDHA